MESLRTLLYVILATVSVSKAVETSTNVTVSGVDNFTTPYWRPPPERQKTVITSLMDSSWNINNTKNQKAYPISKKWMEDWNSYVNGTIPEHKAFPRPIEVDTDFSNSSDILELNQMIQEKVWKVLADWYNVDKDNDMTRFCLGNHEYTYYYRRSSYNYGTYSRYKCSDSSSGQFIRAYITHLRDNSDVKYLPNEESLRTHVFHKEESLGYIKSQMIHLLKARPHYKTRLWIRDLSSSNSGPQFRIINEEEQFARYISDKFIGEKTKFETFPENERNVLLLHQAIIKQLEIERVQNEKLRKRFSGYYSSNNAIEKTVPILAYSTPQVILGIEIQNEKGEWPITYNSDPSYKPHLQYLEKFQPGTSFLGKSAISEQHVWDAKVKALLPNLKQSVTHYIDQNFKVFVQELKHTAYRREQSLGQKESTLMKLKHVLEDVEDKMQASEKELEKAMADYTGELYAYQQEKQKFEDEKEQFHYHLKQVRKMNQMQTSLVTLNIGGQKFVTSVETLKADSTSKLGAMFSGLYNVTQEDDGSYFIDRDGTYFRFILNYLRDGGFGYQVLPSDTYVLGQVLIEAEFYEIDGLVRYLKEELEKYKRN